MAVLGDFHRLAQLRMQLERIASGGLMADAGRALANETHRLVIDGFNRQSDPNGRAWPPLKDEQPRTLQKTGRLLHSITSRFDGRRVVVRTVGYGAFHARFFLPMTASLGPVWGDAYARVTGRIVRAMLGGR